MLGMLVPFQLFRPKAVLEQLRGRITLWHSPQQVGTALAEKFGEKGNSSDLLARVPFWMLALLLMIGAGALYLPSVNAYFVSDDFIHIVERAHQAIPATGDHFRPLAAGIIKGLYSLFGLNPVPFHLFLIGLHAASVGLALRLVVWGSRRKDVGALAAVLYATYPRHHEPVVWVSAGSSVLPAAVFGLATLVAFERATAGAGRMWWAASCAAFILALLSSEWAIVLIGVMAAMLRWGPASGSVPPTPPRRGHLARSLLPFVVIALFYLPLQFGGPGSAKLTTTGPGYHFLGMRSFSVQWARFFVYGWLPILSLDSLGRSVGSVLAMVAGVALSLGVLSLGSPRANFWTVWIWITSLPFAAFGIFGPAERHFYLIALGPAALTADVVIRSLERALPSRRGVALAAAFLAVVSLAAVVDAIERRIDAWVAAGRTVQEILRAIQTLHPTLPEGAVIYAIGLPRANGTAPILNHGIGPALREVYQKRRLETWYTFDQGIGQFLDGAADSAPVPARYVFRYRRGRVEDLSGRYRALAPRFDPRQWIRS